MTNDAPVCYGKYPKCELKHCEFSASCEYYTNTPEEPKRMESGYHIGFRGDENWLPEPAKVKELDDDECCSEPVTRDELVQFFKWLMSLDEYTLGLLQHVYTNESDSKKMSLMEIARSRGCSRQAIYRKVNASIEEHPELFALAPKLFGHMKKSKTRFLRTSALRVGRKQRESKQNEKGK